MLLKCLVLFYMVTQCSMCGDHDLTASKEDLTEEEARKEIDVGIGEDATEAENIKRSKEEYLKNDFVHVEYRETMFDQSEENLITNSSFPKNELIDIPGGSFTMGMEDSPLPGDGEGPERHVTLRPFSIDKFEVSNGEFFEFVSETNYKTEAELFGNSFVMDFFLSQEVNMEITEAVAGANWWLPVHGANWKHPEGKGSTIESRMDYPVVHVSWNDANAFCKWKGKRLPTEAEWEYACRGGKERKLFPWGDVFVRDGNYHANIWQGKFPKENTANDGYNGTCKVNRFLQNDYQLYNMVGNVWEWVGDWWGTQHSSRPEQNPRGPSSGQDKMKKGGSFMCHKSFCYRYRCSARSSNSADSSASNLGFRCVKPSIKKSLEKNEL